VTARAGEFAERSQDVGDEAKRGIYHKYNVTKAEDGSEVTDCFVLRPLKDPFSRAALRAYADACKAEHPVLSREIAFWLNGMERPRRFYPTHGEGGEPL
jgi:hypothetical protein